MSHEIQEHLLNFTTTVEPNLGVAYTCTPTWELLTCGCHLNILQC